MAVMVGSARIDENGKAYGGVAGDQTGKEVSTQTWYKHSKGWRVFRAIDPAKAVKIGRAMEAACANPMIGYDQYQRDTLYNAAKAVGFDPGKVKTPCETDCSALVRVCAAFAGIMLENFRTYNEPSVLLKSGQFVELKGTKYTDQSAYLGAGDILCTPVSGHTVVVLNNGSKYEGTVEVKDYTLGDRILRHGDEGADVKVMQQGLLTLGYDLGKYGVDGDFGDATEMAVRAFQADKGLEVDGEFGPKSLAALNAALNALDNGTAPTGTVVQISGGQCWIRERPDGDAVKIGVATNGSTYPYAGETSGGWLKIHVGDKTGWVSGTYGKLAGEAAKTAKVMVTGGSVNIRRDPSTNQAELGVVHAGDMLPYLGTDKATGWYQVEYNGSAAYISNKYAQLEG